jgi:predicted outer membrane repeat protein
MNRSGNKAESFAGNFAASNGGGILSRLSAETCERSHAHRPDRPFGRLFSKLPRPLEGGTSTVDLLQPMNVGRDVSGLGATQVHVGHFRMGIKTLLSG